MIFSLFWKFQNMGYKYYCLILKEKVKILYIKQGQTLVQCISEHTVAIITNLMQM